MSEHITQNASSISEQTGFKANVRDMGETAALCVVVMFLQVYLLLQAILYVFKLLFSRLHQKQQKGGVYGN